MASWRAASTGERNGAINTLGPNLSRRVRAATAAMVVIGSRTGIGEESRSENQIESISVRSQRSMSRQKKFRPSPGAPAGQGPGMMPIRYLICIGLVHREVFGLLGEELQQRRGALLRLLDGPADRRHDLGGLGHSLAVAAEGPRHRRVVAADVGRA